MKSEIYNLSFLTPCFCAGADQTVAELRSSAIRGQLRWWFRALGGTPEQEGAVFGSTAGGEGCASLLQVRTRLIQRGPDWKPFRMSPGQPGAYIWFFASVASDKKRWWKQAPGRGNQPPGVFNPQGNLPPLTRFQIHIRQLRSVADPSAEKLLRVAIQSLLRFGGVGMRLTRGMGAWECAELDHSRTAIDANAAEITRRGFVVNRGNRGFGSALDAILDGEKWLQNNLRKDFNANKQPASPLGGIRQRPSLRQTSAVYLRPVREGTNYTMLFFEAPHRRVLGDESRAAAAKPVLQGRRLSGTAPEPPPTRRRW